MKLGIMQPYFFPYLGYFQLIHAVDRFILYDNLNYITRGWMNRNRLLVNGKPRFVGVPISNRSSFTKIREIRIENNPRWKRHMLRLIQHSYGRAPYFEQIFPVIERAINSDLKTLKDLNCSSTRSVAELLGIQTPIITDTTNFDGLEAELADPGSETNVLFRDTEGLRDTKTIRLICLCRAEDADTYVNPIGGRGLYDKNVFARHGVELHFIHMLPLTYRQHSSKFVPDLSIIDVLMNCGQAGTRQFLERYEFV